MRWENVRLRVRYEKLFGVGAGLPQPRRRPAIGVQGGPGCRRPLLPGQGPHRGAPSVPMTSIQDEAKSRLARRAADEAALEAGRIASERHPAARRRLDSAATALTNHGQRPPPPDTLLVDSPLVEVELVAGEATLRCGSWWRRALGMPSGWRAAETTCSRRRGRSTGPVTPRCGLGGRRGPGYASRPTLSGRSYEILIG